MITLENILKRNKKTLLDFIQKNKLTSYDDLIQYCKRRKFIPCKEEDYNQVLDGKNEKSTIDRNKKSLDRETSEAQKKRKARNSSKRKQAAPKLPNSNV